MSKQVYLFKNGHDATSKDGRQPDSPIVLEVRNVQLYDGNLIVDQPPEATVQAPYLNLAEFGMILLIDNDSQRRLSIDDQIVDIDAGLAGTYRMTASGVTRGPDDSIVVMPPDGATSRVVFLRDSFVALITTREVTEGDMANEQAQIDAAELAETSADEEPSAITAAGEQE